MTKKLQIRSVLLATSMIAFAGGFAQTGKPESQQALRREAKISLKAATKTALAEVPGGKVRSSELEREKGKLIYSFDIKVAGKKGVEEVNVDAVSGAVVAHVHETAAAEKKESAQERTAKPNTAPKKK